MSKLHPIDLTLKGYELSAETMRELEAVAYDLFLTALEDAAGSNILENGEYLPALFEKYYSFPEVALNEIYFVNLYYRLPAIKYRRAELAAEGPRRRAEKEPAGKLRFKGWHPLPVDWRFVEFLAPIHVTCCNEMLAQLVANRHRFEEFYLAQTRKEKA